MPSLDRREQARPEPPPPPSRLTRLGVWFRDDEMAALHALAKQDNQSETALVRKAVRRLLGLSAGPG